MEVKRRRGFGGLGDERNTCTHARTHAHTQNTWLPSWELHSAKPTRYSSDWSEGITARQLEAMRRDLNELSRHTNAALVQLSIASCVRVEALGKRGDV